MTETGLEKLKIILENAIKEEAYFHLFYRELAMMQGDESVRAKLLELSIQERMHKEKLETLNVDKIGGLIVPEMVDDLEVADKVSNTPMAEFENMEMMFKFAIRQEAMAKNVYASLAKVIGDVDTKQLFERLAAEEAGHEQLLIEEFKKIRGE